MRFASLALERYGRFDDCELTFRAGAPDLHVVYGANEAGKTTSLAAVSDLLFGFQARSPYNFIFDYSLLRVGAVLEDEGRSFACRRKKSTGSSLIDSNDQPLDEGTLLAMLRGQTREAFSLAFSLNQDGLRAGGRAMVEARNDVGRALFAAGSGLTGVSDQLALLEAEADAVWGPRAAARRSFTQAQRELVEHSRAAREQILKPKTWLDARSAVTTAQEVLDGVQNRRDEVLEEVRRAERIRRIAPSVRLRAGLIASLSEHQDTMSIAPRREDAAEAIMAEADAAVRAKVTAERLAREVADRIDALTIYPAVMDQADQIDDLVISSGAVEKARQDLARISTNERIAAASVARLKDEAGARVTVPPTRVISTQLRETAQAQAQDTAALEQIEESERSLDQRRARLNKKADGGGQVDGLKVIVTAVDAARALGADLDVRCGLALRKAELPASAFEQALARLKPWNGDAEALLILPKLAPGEIDEARTALGELAALQIREEQTASRARDEASALTLQMEQLASGPAVSPDEIAAARADRATRWGPLREHLLMNTPLPAPAEAVNVFEATITHADERSDVRFAAADESSRLSLMANRRGSLLLEAEQAEGRATSVVGRSTSARMKWGEGLIARGYPDLEPSRLLGWQIDREAAEAAHMEVNTAIAEAEATRTRRETARADLIASMSDLPGVPSGDDLAPLLAFAERVRKDGEEAAQKILLNQSGLNQIAMDLEDLNQRKKQLVDAIGARLTEWRQLVADAGITLGIESAAATLDVIDELRVAIATQDELQVRVDGIGRDADLHDERVNVMATKLGIGPAKDTAELLALLRSRLTTARSAADVHATFQNDLNSRTSEGSEADAKLSAVQEALKPLYEETSSSDATELTTAIARSRAVRALREEIATAEAALISQGDGYPLEELLVTVEGVDTDQLAGRAITLESDLNELNAEVAVAAAAHGDAKRVFASLDTESGSAVDAATDAEQARAELGELAEHYILKRAQAVTLRWAIEQYRELHQDPLLLRASSLFSALTIGRYAALRIDTDETTPRLLGLRDDGRTVVEVNSMSEGTTDQLFLALRLAAVEQSVAGGVKLPFLADDLFVNFDDERSEAGFRVLAELAQSTQVLFFTHHSHLAEIARSVVGIELHSECALT